MIPITLWRGAQKGRSALPKASAAKILCSAQ
jgi:hypothetical protein